MVYVTHVTHVMLFPSAHARDRARAWLGLRGLRGLRKSNFSKAYKRRILRERYVKKRSRARVND